MLRNSLTFLLLTSTIALVSAYIAQFIFDLQPCILCLYQRQPFFAIIAITLLSLLFFKQEKLQKITFFCCVILLLTNSIIASYQVGVEEKIFQGPTTCSSNELDSAQNIEELQVALLKAKAVRCDEPQFIFLKLSMAAWNVIYCILLVVMAIILFSNHRKNSSLAQKSENH